MRYTRRHVWVAGLEEGEDPLPEEVRIAVIAIGLARGL